MKPKYHKGINVTPQMRADQFPDDFIVKNKALFCKWCERFIGHSRKDNVMEHLYSQLHRQKAKVTGNSRKKEPPKIKITVKKPVSSKKTKSKVEKAQDEEEDLNDLFADSDSSSFDGFAEEDSVDTSVLSLPTTAGSATPCTSGEEARKSGRARKRPARLSEASESEPALKQSRKSESESSSTDKSIPIRSMPIKKQISYNVKKETSETVESTGLLKMKITRKKPPVQDAPTNNSESEDTNENKNIKVVSSSKVSGGQLKLKFVLKNKEKTTPKREKSTSQNSEKVKSPRVETPKPTQIKSPKVTQVKSPKTSKVQPVKSPKSVQPKISKIKTPKIIQPAPDTTNETVTPTDDLGTTDPEVIASIKSDNQTTSVDEMESPTRKGKRIVKKKQIMDFDSTATTQKNKPISKIPLVHKKKAVTKKKSLTTQEKKKKITGYMVWSKSMRSKISAQYPGLEFGDVSKKLGDMWKKLPVKEKQTWHVRSLKMKTTSDSAHLDSDIKTVRKAGSRMIETGPRKKIAKVKPDISYQPNVKHPDVDMEKELQRLSKPASDIIDVAAHFSLLGESFTELHTKVSQSGANITMRDAQATLMDGLLSCLVPLMALTKQVPCLKSAISEKNFQKSLSNIAHIMPGL